MLTKSEIKYIQSLREKKFRVEAGLFIAEGPKLIKELILKNKHLIQKIYCTEYWWKNQDHQVQKLMSSVYTTIQPFELEKISSLQTPQDVLALVEIPSYSFMDEKKWILALDDIQDPGNMGTIIRTAHWFGIEQIICSKNSVDAYTSKVVQATMGSIIQVKPFYEDLIDFFTRRKNIPIYGATLNGQAVNTFSVRKPGIILIGNEGKGISKELIPFITYPVTIPGNSNAESLNAAIATGILLYTLTL